MMSKFVNHTTVMLTIGVAAGVAGCGSADDVSNSEVVESTSEPSVYCPDFTADLELVSLPTTNANAAIGYLNNGCTAVMIDPLHIVAAAHCAVDQTTGDWFPNLRFYPNFHPDRPTPPRYNITRAVVGTRFPLQNTQPTQGLKASDWAIMRLDCGRSPDGSMPWCPQNPLVAPMVMTSSVALGASIRRAGYDRDPFRHTPKALCPPYNSASYPTDEEDACPGDCFAGGAGCDNPINNNWFQEGVRDDSCTVNSTTDMNLTDGYLRTNCSARGGSSGSPMMSGNTMVGITHGIPLTIPDEVACYEGLGPVAGGEGPSAGRFMHAPRFANSVAVAPDDTGTAKTKVWAVDSDMATIRARNRKGTSLSHGWNTWQTHGTAGSEPRAIAAMALTNSRPQVIVASQFGDLFLWYLHATNPPPSVGAWIGNNWDKPSGTTIRDVDSAPDRINDPWVFAVSDHVSGSAWRRKRSSNPYGTWQSWLPIVTGESGHMYQKVTAVRRSGDLKQMAFFVTNFGAVRWVEEPFPATPATLWPVQPVFIVDADAGLTADNKVFVVAVDSSGNLWMRTQTSTSGNLWPNNWVPFAPPLFNRSNGCATPLTGIVSVTASRWMEGANTEPVIFVTDNQGNVYYSEYTTGLCSISQCDCGTKWQPWKSFYHSNRWADY
jgi:V8-like Glu-specific endopeptidase